MRIMPAPPQGRAARTDPWIILMIPHRSFLRSGVGSAS
jgi:hypothetical protein